MYLYKYMYILYILPNIYWGLSFLFSGIGHLLGGVHPKMGGSNDQMINLSRGELYVWRNDKCCHCCHCLG